MVSSSADCWVEAAVSCFTETKDTPTQSKVGLEMADILRFNAWNYTNAHQMLLLLLLTLISEHA